MTERIVWKFPTSLLDSQLNHYDHTCHFNNFVSELTKAELKHLWCDCFNNHRSFLQNNVNCPVSVTTTYKAILVKFIDILLNPNNLNLIKCVACTHDENELMMDYNLVGTSLYDVIRYSPGRLRNHNTLLFLAFQVIHTIKQLHEMNLPHGGITLHNIFVDEKFDIFLGLPKTIEIFSNMKVDELNEEENIMEDEISACSSIKLSTMTTNWVLHKVSNYDYLMFLNELAGRHKGDPSNSAILPWITNFDTPSGQLRDLTKSKYHLCKGEDQLNANFTASLYNHTISKRPSWSLGSYCSEVNYDDRHHHDFIKLCDESGVCNLNNQNTNLLCSITGEHLSNDIGKNHMNFTFSPHHLLDIMPDLTYYTYMARKTPLSVLTQFVRPIYQPQEFPTTIARLYESTPDECIPEFFTDVSVFSSIHPDMPDLGLPFWCSTPEEFIKYHSSLLESDEVSSNLHHWIDLNFGYKLLGSDAVNAKNVHLELAGDQSSIRRTGVVCLFHTPHPQRICSKNLSKYFGATLPDIFQTDLDVLAPGNNSAITKVHASNSANKVSLAQHNSTLRKQMKSVSGSKVNYTVKLPTDDAVSYSKNKIWLPHDYDPLELINMYQGLCKFLYIETHVDDLNELQSIQLSKLNNYDNDFDNLFKTDLESLGCLIVELSLYYAVSYIEANKWSHEERVNFARLQARLHWDKIPNCLHDAVNSVLYPFDENLNGEQFQKRFLPTVDIFLHLICEFPPYIFDLLYVRDWLNNITNGDQSSQPLQLFSPYLPKTCLFAAFFPCFRQNELYDLTTLPAVHIPINIIKLLYPHIQSAVSANPSWFLSILNSTKILGLFSSVGGIELVRSHLLPLVISLYKPEQLKRMSSDISSGIPIALLYSRCFLRRLLAYLDVNTFLVHIVPYITLGLIGGSVNALTDENIIWHQRSFTGLTSELDTSDLNAKRNTPDSFSNSMDLNDESLICSQSENVSTTPYDLLSNKQDTMKVDEIGIDLRSLINDDELQFLEDAKSSSLIPCVKSNVEECDIVSHKSVDGCLIDVTSTLPAYSSRSFLEYSKLPQSLYDGSTEDKPEQKKASTSDSTPVINNNSSNFSNVNNIPPVTAAMDSLDWLARRVGPVITIKYIVKYLLSTLILCYEGKSQLSVNTDNMASFERCFQFYLQVNNYPLVGDRSASSVLRCLEQLIQIYGVSLVLDVYLPYVLKTITSITSPAVATEDTNMNSLNDINDYSMNSTEINNSYKTNVCTTLLNLNYRNLAQLIGALTLFYHIVIYLPDNELVELLQESVLQDILIKAVQISGRLDVNFPGGVIGRRAILYKFINVVFVIGIRVGFELSRTQLTSIFQVFFALFDRVINTTATQCILANNSYSSTRDNINNGVGDKCHPELQCATLPATENVGEITKTSNPSTVFTELIETFNSDLARLAYISFCHLAGGSYIDDCLYNTQSIQKLINQLILNESNSSSLIQSCYGESDKTIPVAAAPTNIQDVQSNRSKVNFEATLFSSSTLYSNSRFHLPLAWRHVIRDIHETSSQHPSSVLKYHGVHVAAFTGHINKINCITHLNTENCFVTTSRDKTVQLWSLTDSYNSGHNSVSINQRISNISNNISHSTKSILIDSTNNVVARLVYRAHRKSVIAAHYLEPYRLVASTDGRLIFWDPCTGKTVRSNCQWENSSWQNLIAMNRCSVPYGTVICSDQSGFVHLIDPRAVHSGRTGSLRFHSGANLASFLINKERPKLETSSYVCSKNANCVSKLTPYCNQSTSSSSITNIMMNITNQFHPYHLSINSLTSVNSSSSITSLMNSSTNMAGLLNCLTTSQNGHYLLCGFTTGMITLLDLRMGQVIHVWKEYQDAIVDVSNLCFFVKKNNSYTG
ncbi:WD repeat-containing protein 81 [Schistosoma japonicum]|nr:WD repeat-containing protein 81 [Schistosoma japonicum]